MATTQGAVSASYLAGADLSASTNQWKAVKLSAARTVVLCAAATDTAEGILTSLAVSGAVVQVDVSGETKAMAGAAFSVGALLTFDSSGRLITAASGNRYRAIAIEAAGAAGDIVSVRLISSANLIA